jgi:hypothetical protein
MAVVEGVARTTTFFYTGGNLLFRGGKANVDPIGSAGSSEPLVRENL